MNRRTFLAGLMAAPAAGFLAPKLAFAFDQLQPAPQGHARFASQFFDIAHEAGLTAPMIFGDVGKSTYIVEAIGGGCAFLDYDNDGWMDIFMVCGTRLSGAPPGATNRLYKNNRDGTFSDVTEKAGLHHVGWGNGVCVGDYNNDGYDDLFCTYYGQNRLYRNNGNGTFTDVTKEAGLIEKETRYGTGCTFIDYNRDGFLDLFVSNYVDMDLEHAPKPSVQSPTCSYEGLPVLCGPRGLKPGYHSLYRNNGDGTFTDVSKEAGIAEMRSTYGLTAVSADFDEDGWPDIYVAGDSTPSLLFINNHDGTFKEDALSRGVAVSGEGRENSGMGVGVGDYMLEGHVDIFKTHFQREPNGLYRNSGKGDFDDVTTMSGIVKEQRFVGWGAGIVDLDNDGYPDLFMVAGNIYPELEKAFPQLPYRNPRIIFRNLRDGRFEELTEEAGPGMAAKFSSRGCAFGDFDNDGDLDVVIVNVNDPPSLLRNDSPNQNHWLKVKLIGTKSNRRAIGARVIAHYGKKAQAQNLMSQSSYLSCNDPRLHFGLGAETKADIEIFWPNGLHESFNDIAADQMVTIKEGSGITATAKFDSPKISK